MFVSTVRGLGFAMSVDIAEIANAPGGPNPAKMAEVMARHGLVLARGNPAPPA